MQEKLQLYYSKQDAKRGHQSFGCDLMDQSLPRAANTIHQLFPWKTNILWHNQFKVPNNIKCKDSEKNSDVNKRTRHKQHANGEENKLSDINKILEYRIVWLFKRR